MDPQHHYDKPGKAPDGMDLVPMYASEQSAPAAAKAASPPPAPGERKILYWYDPMHPQYKADKPGKARIAAWICVPIPDATAASVAPGSVNISPDKQQLIGVRTARVERQSLVRDVRTTGQVTADEFRIAMCT